MADLLPWVEREWNKARQRALDLVYKKEKEQEEQKKAQQLSPKTKPTSQPRPKAPCQTISLRRLRELAYRPSLMTGREKTHLKTCASCRGRLQREQRNIDHPDDTDLALYMHGIIRDPEANMGFIRDHMDHRGCERCREKIGLPKLSDKS